MADKQTFQGSEFQNGEYDKIAQTASQVREDIERLVEGFDIDAVVSRVEQFGKANPVGLALSALTLGLAAGFLMRGTRRLPNG